MLSKDEAQRIASAVNALRPDWSINGLMSVLGDTRCRNRPRKDLTIAFVTLALDETSRKPTRIYEHGPWWEVLAPKVGTTVSYRELGPDDCDICSRPQTMHPISSTDNHAWEPQDSRGKGHAPTPEQRAAIDAAAAEAKAKATAEREAVEAREVATVDEVLGRHQGGKDDEQEDMA